MSTDQKNAPRVDEKSKQREQALLEMGKALRALSMYPEKHPQRAKLMEQAHGSLLAILVNHGDFSFQVARTGFTADSLKYGAQDAVRELAQEMHVRQVKSFSLRDGLDARDFTSFMEMLTEDPEKFRAGRYIERWFTERNIRTIWVNEMDFSKMVTAARAEPEENREETREVEDPVRRLSDLVSLLDREEDPDRFVEILREAEVMIRTLVETKQFKPAWWALSAISIHGEGREKTGVAAEQMKAQALGTVNAAGKSGFLHHLLEMYAGPDDRDDKDLERVFKQIGPRVVEEALDILARKEAIGAYRPLVSLILSYGDQAREILESRVMAGEDPILLRKSAYLLGEFKDKRSVPALKPMLTHKDDKVRREAVRALIRFRSMEASRALVNALQVERDPGVRIAIVQSLAESKNLAAVPQLINLLQKTPVKEDTVPLLEAVVEALGRIGSREALPPLVKLLVGRSIIKRRLKLPLRIKAAEALGELGGESAIQALVRCARPSDKPLEKKCTEVLGILLEGQEK